MLITGLFSDVVSEKPQTTNKAVILYGARKLGKTTLSELIIDKLGHRALIINADQGKYIEVLSSRDLNKLQSLVHGDELDYIEEGDGALNAVGIKYNKGKTKASKSWVETYPDSEFQLINKENYLDSIM